MPMFVRLLFTISILGLAAADRSMATEESVHYNQVHFQVERSRPVENDRMQAVLSVTAEGENAARVANQINRTMDWAVEIAKTRSKIEVRTGNYQTYPVYDKNKIRRWRATQQLALEGTDFTGLSDLVGQLQERLQVTSINFSLSPARRAAVEDDLITQALDAFKQRAELVRKQLAGKSYRIIEAVVSTNGGEPVPIMRGIADMKPAAESVVPPTVQAGTSTLTVSVDGVIELQ
ncbi:MAG: SIMPL domain-containing protein [Acidiferrobacterales bacterium]|nr:SIMPL domain-containing protein [Acidiferrobacterales bacterium]